jgi:GT2 family glycosyltransferase
VVVATHNRAKLLPRLIAGLASQQGVDSFEVVIVDDASRDETGRTLAELASEAPITIRSIRLSENVGAAAARNVGWRATRAPLIAFTDDDCVPQPRWLATLVWGLSRHDLVQGRTLPDPEQWEKFGPFARTIDVSAEHGYYETCNMGYRRSALERVGGFDEEFRYPYGEDCDLAWRVKDGGATSVFLSDAVVYHDIWPSDYGAYLRDKVRREGLVLALRKHPALRRQRGLFQNGTHSAAILALGGGLAFLQRPKARTFAIAACLGVPYAWNCRHYHPGPARKVEWIRVLPMHLLADLYEVGVLARASLRYGTVVL